MIDQREAVRFKGLEIHVGQALDALGVEVDQELAQVVLALLHALRAELPGPEVGEELVDRAGERFGRATAAAERDSCILVYLL